MIIKDLVQNPKGSSNTCYDLKVLPNSKGYSPVVKTPKYFLKVLVHLCRTLINGVTASMSFFKDPTPQIINIRYIQSPLVPKNTIPPY